MVESSQVRRYARSKASIVSANAGNAVVSEDAGGKSGIQKSGIGKQRRRRHKAQGSSSGWATCVVVLICFGVISLMGLQVFLVVQWLGLGLGNNEQYDVDGLSGDPVLRAARDTDLSDDNLRSTSGDGSGSGGNYDDAAAADDDPVAAFNLNAGGSDSSEEVSLLRANGVANVRLREVLYAMHDGNKFGNAIAPWSAIPDSRIEQWFDALELKSPSLSQPPEEADLGALSAMVAQTVDTVKHGRRALATELGDNNLLQLISQVFSEDDKVDVQVEGNTGSSPGNDFKYNEHHVHHERTNEGGGQCSEWAMLRESNVSSSSFSFSIAGSVPSAHAALWRKALSGILGFKENVASADKRVLILPWTFEASLLSIHDSIMRRNKGETKAVFSRVTDPGFALWPLVSRREVQAAGLAPILNGAECSAESLGIRPPSFSVSDADQCKDMFERFSDELEAKMPWFVKQPAQVVCPPSPVLQDDNASAASAPACQEVESDPVVVRGIAGLRRQFGRCTGSYSGGSSVLLERAVAHPLLVHSRRVKLHAMVLVTSARDPWQAFIFPGFVTLAAPNARTVINEDVFDPTKNAFGDSSSSAAGAAVADIQALRRETTDLKRQRQQHLLQPGQIPGLWEFARFKLYLESFGHCKGAACDKLMERMKTIARVVIEASIVQQQQQHLQQPLGASGVDLSKTTGFQVFRLSFWIDERLNPYFHRGTADLGFLMDYAGENAVPGLQDSMTKLLAEAVQLKLGSNKPALWSSLKDEFHEKCVEQVRAFNPCRDVFKVPLLVIKQSNASQEQIEQRQTQEEQRQMHKQEEQTTNKRSDSSGGMRIAFAAEPRFSPKSDLPKERRHTHVPLDEL